MTILDCHACAHFQDGESVLSCAVVSRYPLDDVFARNRPLMQYAWRGSSALIVDNEGATGELKIAGFYFCQTRYLSRLELRINGERPFLWVSTSSRTSFWQDATRGDRDRYYADGRLPDALFPLPQDLPAGWKMKDPKC